MASTSLPQFLSLFRQAYPSRRKPLICEVNQRGCFICTSHHRDLKGYPHLRVKNASGNWITKFLSRVAYELLNGPVPPGLVVRHKCDDRACVNPDHLEIGTYRDNAQDMVTRGRAPTSCPAIRGENHHRAKLTEGDVVSIRESSSETFQELADKFGVSKTTVKSIRRGDCWKHVTPLKATPRRTVAQL